MIARLGPRLSSTTSSTLPAGLFLAELLGESVGSLAHFVPGLVHLALPLRPRFLAGGLELREVLRNLRLLGANMLELLVELVSRLGFQLCRMLLQLLRIGL